MEFELPIGKRVAENFYVHISAIALVGDVATRKLITDSLARLPEEDVAQVNVIKIHQRTRAVSLLQYDDFDTQSFPRLKRGWICSGTGSISKRTYEHSSNPPILHRKELLVAHNYPGRTEWLELTRSAEALGLFDETATIGFALNWDRLIASKGLQLVEGRLLPLGNEHPSVDDADTTGSTIHRHRTALSRASLSTPVQLLARHELLRIGTTFFDYGCGRGGDMERLAAAGFSVAGWDPYYASSAEIKAADVVNLGFVINVIEEPAERLEALKRAFSLCGKVMSVGVMLSGRHAEGYKAFGDGFLSGRNTFQKYFSQTEFKSYLETVLENEAHLVGPGIAFVFADPNEEFRFLSSKYRSRDIAPRLLALTNVHGPKTLPHHRKNRIRSREPRRSSPESVMELKSLWTQSLELGRIPKESEAINAASLLSEFSSYRKAVNALKSANDMSLLDHAARTRRDDLDVYFAMQHFIKQANRKNPDPSLQSDIRHFYGTFGGASAAGMRLLLAAADPQKIYEACVVASEHGIGWLDAQTSLQLEAASVERLPAVLRAYVACASQLCGEISEYQIVKIHIRSGKVSLMDYVDYDSALPRLRRRIKVNLRQQDLQVFEYGSPEHPMAPLHQKSRFMTEDKEGYAEQIAFDEQLDSLGLTVFDRDFQELDRALCARRLEFHGRKLRRSTRNPELDERCGRYLSYRDFIECGETRKRLGLANRPMQVESYNALYDLAVNVLDPTIEYFGAIKLTYGLCTRALGAHIRRRVAPKLDQHAAAERNLRGALICERGGASCDFVVEDENMAEVADWIIANTPFDRLYYYGPNKPLHVSYGPQHSRCAFRLTESAKGRLSPSKYVVRKGQT